MEENHQITLNEWIEMKEAIRRELNNVKHAFVRVGYYLRRAEDEKLYLQDGYSSLAEFAQKEYGLTATTVSRFMSINRKYSVDGYSAQLLPEYQDYKQSVLVEMLSLPDGDMQMVTPETPREDVRELARFNRQEPDRSAAGGLEELIRSFFLHNREAARELAETGFLPEEKIVEILNPSGSRTYRKGMFFLSMTDKDIKIKKFGGTPQSMGYMEFMEQAQVVLNEIREGKEEADLETEGIPVHKVPGENPEETEREQSDAAEDPGDGEDDPGTEDDDLEDGGPDQEQGGTGSQSRISPDGNHTEGEGAGNPPAEDGEGEPEPQKPVAPAQLQEEEMGRQVPESESGEDGTEEAGKQEPVSASGSAGIAAGIAENRTGTVENPCDSGENAQTGGENVQIEGKMPGSKEKCSDPIEKVRISEKDALTTEENNDKSTDDTENPVEGMMNPPEPVVRPETDEHAEAETEGTGITHNLKIRSEFFRAVSQGTKTFELRKDDRDYQAGDQIMLMEFEEGRFTGNTIKKTITYKLAGFEGLQPGYCILAIQ